MKGYIINGIYNGYYCEEESEMIDNKVYLTKQKAVDESCKLPIGKFYNRYNIQEIEIVE